MVRYWYEIGSYQKTEHSLRRAIGQYARNYKYIYIGLTQQRPHARFSKHQSLWPRNKRWKQMVVIYRAPSFNQMCRAERQLIKYAKAHEDSGWYNCIVVNIDDSRRPRKATNPDGFWIYILLGNK